MKFKRSILLSSILFIAACSNNDNKVDLEMKSCEGTECSFDASKSKIKSHSHILEYDWEFHDGTEQKETKEPTITHDFDIHVGATLDGNDPDLDLREVTLDEVLTGNHIITKTFKFRTHQHDPKAILTAKSQVLLGAENNSSQIFDLDASESVAGQGQITKYIWEIDKQRIETETPDLQYTFSEKSSGDVKLTVVNKFGVTNTVIENVNILKAEPQIADIEIAKVLNSDGLHYNFNYDADDFDPGRYHIKWELNGETITDTQNILVKDGENVIEVSLVNNNGRYVNTLARHFNTNYSPDIKINSIAADPVKYSDGLHYNFIGSYNKLDYTVHKVLWELNGQPISSPGNVLVPEGTNAIKAIIVDKDTGETIDEKEITFVAEEAALHISHVQAIMQADILHYSFSDLTYSFNPEKYQKIWELNGNIITDLTNVEVQPGMNTVTLSIKDIQTGEVLTSKSNTWDTGKVASILEMKVTKIENADDLHYKLTATLDNNYNSETQHLEWTVDDAQITNPENAELHTGRNKVILYVIDNATGNIITAKNIKVDVLIKKPEIKDVEAIVDPDLANKGLTYSFRESVDNYDSSKYHLEWLLNDSPLANPINATVKDGQNTIQLNVINNYTGGVTDTFRTNFVAKAMEPRVLDIVQQKLFDSDGLHYDFSASTDEYDKDKYSLKWELNGVSITDIKNVLVNKGENSIKAAIVDNNNNRYVSSLTEHFDTNITSDVRVDTARADFVKYSDGLHYNFYATHHHMDYDKYKVVWSLNGSSIASPGNVPVPAGLNTATVGIKDIKTGEIVDQKTIEFTAEKLPLNISHIIVNEGSDRLHYNFYDLTYSYDDSSMYKEWVLNGEVITGTNEVLVNNGHNTLTLYIKDKANGNILNQESKEWDVGGVVAVTHMQADKIENADDLHYKLSAIYDSNYDSTKNYVVWTINNRTINDPQNAQLDPGMNKIIVYVYNNSNELVGADYIKVDIGDIALPKIRNIIVNVDKDLETGGGLGYSFDYTIDDYDYKKYHVEWLLNGKPISSSQSVIVEEGTNTIRLNVINNYTGNATDSYETEFVAEKTAKLLKLRD